MNYEKLKQNIIDAIEEQQLKLGYLKETVRLYYPLESLNRFLELEDSVDEMDLHLQDFAEHTKEILGGVHISKKGKRFCIAVPPEGTETIHRCLNQHGFLAELISAVREHGCTMEKVLEIFRKYSTHVKVQKVSNGEFDYLVYFENGQPDYYRYCISVEGNHLIYHRYTPEDYEEFGF